MAFHSDNFKDIVLQVKAVIHGNQCTHNTNILSGKLGLQTANYTLDPTFEVRVFMNKYFAGCPTKHLITPIVTEAVLLHMIFLFEAMKTNFQTITC